MLKKILIILCILILFNITPYTYAVSEIEYTITSGKSFEDGGYYKTNSTYWTGHEWIKGKQKSNNLVQWESISQNTNINDLLESHNLVFVWDDDSYIAFDDLYKNSENILYRISSDFNEVIETNYMPYYIHNINKAGGTYYIETYDGVAAGEYKNYMSKDLINWTEYNFEDLPISCQDVVIIPNYTIRDSISGYKPQITDAAFYELYNERVLDIAYECFRPKRFMKWGKYFYTYDNKRSVLGLSADGIYWEEIPIPLEVNNIVEVFGYGEDSIIAMSEQIVNTEKKIYNVIFNKKDINDLMQNSKIISAPHIVLQNKILGFSQPPVMEDDRILVPMRFLFEQMGASVDWNDETQTATATISERTPKGEIQNTVTFSIDNTTATVNGEHETMDVPACLINDQTFVPLRFLSENLGCDVQWDETVSTAIVTT